MNLTGRVRHRVSSTGRYGTGQVLALQVEVVCPKKTPEGFRRGIPTTAWVDAKVEHLAEINIKGELRED